MRYFIVCDHCGQFNDASSEYLIFCIDCHKKIQGNFRDWHRQNPDAEIKDFHLAVCVPESTAYPSEGLAEDNSKARKISRHLKILIIVLLCLLSFIIVVKDTALINSITSAIGLSEGDWTRKIYGNYGLSIESPHLLQDISSRLPEAGNGLIEHLQAFSSPPEEMLSIVIISTKFDQRVGPVDIQGSISGFVSQIRNLPGISDFRISQAETEISGIDGFEQKGSFLKEGKMMSFQSVGITRGRLLWQVMIVFPGNDAGFEAMSQKVMKSIEILYNSSV